MIFLYLYLLLVLLLSLIFKKRGILLNYSGDVHQSFSNRKNIPLTGGLFILIPIVFFLLLNSFGTLPPEGSMNVNGPGKALFMSLKISFGTGREYLLRSLRSEQRMEK